MRLTEREVVAVLREHGYKATLQRRAIIRAIITSQGHLDPATIFDKARRGHPDMGLVTVYRTLKILNSLGLICEVHAGGKYRNYLLRRSANHRHHLLCSKCGLVVDFTGWNLSSLEHKLSQETGFQMESYLLEFLGYCPDCQKVI